MRDREGIIPPLAARHHQPKSQIYTARCVLQGDKHARWSRKIVSARDHILQIFLVTFLSRYFCLAAAPFFFLFLFFFLGDCHIPVCNETRTTEIRDTLFLSAVSSSHAVKTCWLIFSQQFLPFLSLIYNQLGAQCWPWDSWIHSHLSALNSLQYALLVFFKSHHKAKKLKQKIHKQWSLYHELIAANLLCSVKPTGLFIHRILPHWFVWWCRCLSLTVKTAAHDPHHFCTPFLSTI